MNDNRTPNRLFQWRRILAAVFACILLTGLLPARAEGEALVQAIVVRDVKTHMTLTGTPYITYSLNGLECDSRYTGAKYNERAFQHMTKAQKNTVTSHFWWPSSARMEQFGQEGVQTICDYVNNRDGWTHAWKVMADRAQGYAGELQQWYGGVNAEDDPDRYYNQTLESYKVFEQGSAAAEILEKYKDRPEAADFMTQYNYIQELMKTGKDHYTNCVKSWEGARDAGTKAISNWCISTIVDNFVVPNALAKPSATMEGVNSAMWTVYDNLAALTTQAADAPFTGAVSVPWILINGSRFVTGRESYSPGDGAEQVKRFRALADKNYELAKTIHDCCDLLYDELLRDAEALATQIEANVAQEEQDREDAAQLMAVLLGEIEDASAYYEEHVGDVTLQSAEEDPAEEAVLMEDVSYESIYNASAGLTPPSVTYDLTYGALTTLTDSELGTLESDVEAMTAYYNRKANGYESNAASARSLFNKGLSQIKQDGSTDINTSGLAGFIANNTCNAKENRRNADQVQRNYRQTLINRSNYRDFLIQHREDFDRYFTGFEQCRDSYMALAARRDEILEKLVPDYVRSQQVKYYVDQLGVSRWPNSSGAERLNATSNAALNALIRQAYQEGYDSLRDGSSEEARRQAGIDAECRFFKEQADQLEGYYEELRTITDRMTELKRAAWTMLDRAHRAHYVYVGNYTLSEQLLDDYSIPHGKFTDNYYANLSGKETTMFYAGSMNELPTGTISDANSRIAWALQLLVQDFKGMGPLNMDFAEAYSNFMARKPAIKRQILSGDLWSLEDDPSVQALRKAMLGINGSSSTDTYVRFGCANIGLPNELQFQDEMQRQFDELNAMIEKRNNEEPVDYVPATGIAQGKASLMDAELQAASALTLTEGQQGKLTATVQPANATDKGVVWESLDPDIASVDENGVVTANNAGKATIRARAADAPLEPDSLDYPAAFLTDFPVTVKAGGVQYDTIAQEDDLINDELNNYSWIRTGNGYLTCTQENGRLVVSARFKADEDGRTLVLAVYDGEGKQVGIGVLANNSDEPGIRTLSAMCEAGSVPARGKVFFLSAAGQPVSDVLIDEALT